MSPFCPSLQQLKEHLRSDEGHDLVTSAYAVKVGQGSGTVAYKIGVFVVKKPYWWAEHPHPDIRKAPTLQVGEWTVQLAYVQLAPSATDDDAVEYVKRWFNEHYGGVGLYDSHIWNIGLDRRGRFVQFDW